MSTEKCSKPPMMMKLKRKRFSVSQRVQNEPYIKQKPPSNSYCYADEVCKRKSMNPFQTTKKTQNLLDLKEPEKPDSDSLFSMLSKPKQSQVSTLNYILPEFGSNLTTTSSGPSPGTQCVTPQPDWSIKTEYKLLSTAPFKWCAASALKPGEEAKCTAMFTSNNVTEDAADKEKLRCYLSYWVSPSIPWLRLFPRDRPTVSKSENTVLKPEAVAGLHNEWESSFESLFGLLKTGHCSYFYLCSHHTTVLFRTIDKVLSADMVPTTYGVRTTLKQEDIDFTMPLAPDLTNTEQEQENLDTNNEDAGDARDFLDSLGIDSKKYSELDPSMVKIREAGKLKLDHSIRSLVRVKGSHVQGLFNYLLNNKNLTANVGELAGVPPTLLAPSVFVGGSIRHCQVKCGSSHARQIDGGMKLIHFLHVTGPLLPSSVQNINHLLTKSQGDYSGKLSALQNSTAYNAPDIVIKSGSESLDHKPDKPNRESEKCTTIHELEYKDNLFTLR